MQARHLCRIDGTIRAVAPITVVSAGHGTGHGDHGADNSGHGATAVTAPDTADAAPVRRDNVGAWEETAAGTAPPVPCQRSGHAEGLARGGGCWPVPATAEASAAGGGLLSPGLGGRDKKSDATTNQRCTVSSDLVGTLGLLYGRIIFGAAPVSSFLKGPLHYNFPNGLPLPI